MKHVYLVNPAAGQGDESQELIQKIRAAYPENSEPEVEIYRTKCVGDACRFVREHCEADPQTTVFFACGGDGTLNEVANGAADYPHAIVGLVPCGTGNDFAKEFTCPENFFDFDAQRAGTCVSLDMIRCNDGYYVNLLNTGFDCEVVNKVADIKRKPWVPGGMAYVMGVALTLIKKPGVLAEIVLDSGVVIREKMLLCAVGNGAYYGGGFKPLPHASMTDGLLDICYVKDVSRLCFVSLVGAYKKGFHLREKTKNIIRYIRCKTVRLLFPEEQDVCRDGEITKFRSCDIEAMPGKLRFLLPRGCDVVVWESESPYIVRSDAAEPVGAGE